jgi:hypothetical protein
MRKGIDVHAPLALEVMIHMCCGRRSTRMRNTGAQSAAAARDAIARR